jgi:hypothetical protein
MHQKYSQQDRCCLAIAWLPGCCYWQTAACCYACSLQPWPVGAGTGCEQVPLHRCAASDRQAVLQVLQLLGQADIKPGQQLVDEDKLAKTAAAAAAASLSLADKAALGRGVAAGKLAWADKAAATGIATFKEQQQGWPRLPAQAAAVSQLREGGYSISTAF